MSRFSNIFSIFKSKSCGECPQLKEELDRWQNQHAGLMDRYVRLNKSIQKKKAEAKNTTKKKK